MSQSFNINPDIAKAETLPSIFYKNQDIFEEVKEKIFLKSWQWLGDNSGIKLTNSIQPLTLLDGFLSEPILLTRDNDGLVNCMSNVCTHRGHILALGADKVKRIRCAYHGRTFDLKGNFKSMPEFSLTEDFPRDCDNLYQFPLFEWGPFLFAGLNPSFDFEEVINPIKERIGFLPLDQFSFDSSMSKDYLVQAHWALYCDNYLEGFHIPFVHENLNKVLDYGSYKTELYKYSNLQIGYSDDSNEVFDLPKDHIDYGKKVAAYYYWVFPNMMFNFYPWGLSVNIVKPISINRTKVSFLTYIYDESKLHKGAGNDIDKVEREDEFIVENESRGIQSAFYQSGRFSPTREQGVHHFQRLIAKFLK